MTLERVMRARLGEQTGVSTPEEMQQSALPYELLLISKLS
jgi:hypothetical protein